MSIPENASDNAQARSTLVPRRPGRWRVAAIAALVGGFAVGSGITAVALQSRQPVLVMLTPAPIASLKDWNAAAVKGQVAEIFGNKFIIQDDSGRALVETGPAGEGGRLVAKAETVTVQGRFEHGFLHAQAISHADGHNDYVGPPGRPPGGPLAFLRGPAGHLFVPDAR